MAIPDYQTLMLPVLKFAAKGEFHKADAAEAMAQEFSISEEEKSILLPSGQGSLLLNRVGWAVVYLLKAGLIERPRRAVYKISIAGREALNSNPPKIDNKFLQQFASFAEFRASSSLRQKSEVPKIDVSQNVLSNITPDEQIESAFTRLNQSLQFEVLDLVRKMPPTSFERLILSLLAKMGYGTLESCDHIGKSHDGGIDGVIYQDALGLDAVYIQAKRYKEGSGISVESLRAFVGSLDEHNAAKGVFVTTSHFTNEAVKFESNQSKRLVLIDGEKLAELMIKFQVGVKEYRTIKLQQIDNNVFDEN